MKNGEKFIIIIIFFNYFFFQIKIVFSGNDDPGEGEHKILHYIR